MKSAPAVRGVDEGPNPVFEPLAIRDVAGHVASGNGKAGMRERREIPEANIHIGADGPAVGLEPLGDERQPGFRNAGGKLVAGEEDIAAQLQRNGAALADIVIDERRRQHRLVVQRHAYQQFEVVGE